MPKRTPQNSSATASPTGGSPESPHENRYRIAAVSKLTGMPVPTIRMWERRYSVVTPARSAANGRLYSRTDIDRLVLLKAAVDAGHAIGTIAPLSEEQLRARLEESPAPATSAPREDCQVLVYGTALAQRLEHAWAGRADIRVNASLPGPAWGTIESGADDSVKRADAVVVDAPTLHAGTLRQLRQLRQQAKAQVMIVIYGFSSRQTLARLDQEGFLALASPVDPAQLARVCHLGLAMEPQHDASVERRLLQPAGRRRYADQFLAEVAGTTSRIRCECPHHLADLLTKLNAFETYSLECENTSIADASIHALLHAAASHCRELLEHALAKVLEHEGIDDPHGG